MNYKVGDIIYINTFYIDDIMNNYDSDTHLYIRLHSDDSFIIEKIYNLYYIRSTFNKNFILAIMKHQIADDNYIRKQKLKKLLECSK